MTIWPFPTCLLDIAVGWYPGYTTTQTVDALTDSIINNTGLDHNA